MEGPSTVATVKDLRASPRLEKVIIVSSSGTNRPIHTLVSSLLSHTQSHSQSQFQSPKLSPSELSLSTSRSHLRSSSSSRQHHNLNHNPGQLPGPQFHVDKKKQSHPGRRARLRSRMAKLASSLYGRLLAATALVALLFHAFPISRPQPATNLKTTTQSHSRLRVDERAYVDRIEWLINNAPTAPFRLMSCSMIYNEAPDLLEWLFYHIEQGFQHFVIYDHHSTDNTRELLLPLVELGWVTYRYWNITNQWAQSRAFRSCAEEFKMHTDRLLFFDADEFLVRNSTSTADELPLIDWIDTQFDSNIGGIFLPRLSFGSNGLYSRPAHGILASYTETRVIDKNFFSPKVMGKPRFMVSGDIHSQKYSDGLEMVDSSGRSGDAALKSYEGYHLYLHHYWAKSYAECQEKILQAAFPGSWRFKMGDKFCRTEMVGTLEHAAFPRVVDDRLAKFGPPLQEAIARFHQRFPIFDKRDYTLYIASSTSRSLSTTSFPHLLDRPLQFTLETPASQSGVLSSIVDDRFRAILVGQDLKRYLLPTSVDRHGVGFNLPNTDEGYLLLSISRTFVGDPSPLRDPQTPCAILSKLRSSPHQPELKKLWETVCSEVNIDTVEPAAVAFAARPTYRKDELLHQFFKTQHQDDLNSIAPPYEASELSLEDLGRGRWKRYPLHKVREAGASVHAPKLCPTWYEEPHWGSKCGNLAKIEKEGMWKWVPDKLEKMNQFVLPGEDLHRCLGTSTTGEPKRILVVGDVISVHNFQALSCAVEQAGLNPEDHVRHTPLLFESLSILDGSFGLEEWKKALRWDRDVEERYPDFVILNFGLWPVSWNKLSDYERAIHNTIRHVQSLPRSVQVIWRTTTAVHDEPDWEWDPMYQVPPRVEKANEVAVRLWKKAGMKVIDVYEMTMSRDDAFKRDEYCPVVQGEMALVELWGICNLS
ncbi:hypothetical protein T439DRAFT_345973 [Meredithblackwellia eburnea MCA 4105]